jgi:hypothetical protein
MCKEKEAKPYFANVSEGDAIFGLVFGPGKVATVWGDGHYNFEVIFENNYTVPYSLDGIPGWSNNLDFQTIYFADDINVMDYDFAPSEDTLSPKKIIKLRLKDKLEVKCPSGLWQDVNNCPGYIAQDYLEAGKLHLFRKTPKGE